MCQYEGLCPQLHQTWEFFFFNCQFDKEKIAVLFCFDFHFVVDLSSAVCRLSLVTGNRASLAEDCRHGSRGPGLGCQRRVGPSQTRDWTRDPSTGRQGLNHGPPGKSTMAILLNLNSFG